jgi:hypothetical protein
VDYIHLGIGAVIGFHAITYAYWLMRHDNRSGAIGIFILVLAALVLPILRIVERM